MYLIGTKFERIELLAQKTGSRMLMQTVKVCQFSNNWGLWLIIYMIEA